MTLLRAITICVGAVGLLAACTDPIAPLVPSQLAVVHGVQEISVPGQRLDTVLVRLTDARGNGVPGWRIEWRGDGTVEPVDTVTDLLGQARAVWTLPRYPEILYPGREHGPPGSYSISVEGIGVGSVSLQTLARAFVVEAFDADFDYACGVRSGELWCWGSTLSVIENGGASRVPRRVGLPTGVAARDVSVGYNTICIRDTAGVAWCTHQAWEGEFRSIASPPLSQITASSGSSFGTQDMCGLAVADSTAWCWEVGEAGSLEATRISTRPFFEIGAGDGFGCGLDAEQHVWCWGENRLGQLGDGTLVASQGPVAVAGGHQFTSITVGSQGACGTLLLGGVSCWGHGPASPATSIPVPVAVLGIAGARLFIDGSGLGLAIVGEQLRGWFGDQSMPVFAHADDLRPDRVAGGGQACVQAASGEVWCSWILLYGGGDSSPFPSDLLPVPDPSSHVP